MSRLVVRPRHANPLAAAACGILVGTALTMAGSADAQVPSSTKRAQDSILHITFNDAEYDGPYTKFSNLGSAQLAVSARTLDDATLRQARGRVKPGKNKAVRMPHLDASESAPRAVIRVVDRHGSDDLNPAKQDFTFGADFRLDTRTESNASGSTDNGDNLVQRGLYSDQAQYKIQLDHGVALCRVKGAAGEVQVKSPLKIAAKRWYRARCSRTSGVVTLTLTRWNTQGRAVDKTSSSTGRIGDLTPSAPTMPLSIGGKLAPDGSVMASADQFNGRIDNVVLTIG